ncbi:MAG: hypothetical protein QMD65_01790 [Patescibacteria group bacterium]|nr:hypothetical protein [Patescibacteria group bacterium]
MNRKIIEICRDFIEEVLEKEDWFCQLVNKGACDLLLLTGTATRGTKDSFSDIDMFLVCKYKAQVKHSLKPVRLYAYRGEQIELSVVATEKLFNDQFNKENLYWWHKTHIIKSYNKTAQKTLSKASRLSKKEFLDRLWTDFVRFEINSSDIEKQIKRDEPMSVNLLFNENIKLVADSILVSRGEFPQYKWFGDVLKLKDPKLYKTIIRAQHSKNFMQIKRHDTKLKRIIVKILKQNGFTEKEISNWENCNLKRIIFQYR